MTRYHVGYDHGHRVYLTTNGIDRRWVGDAHEKPRPAIRLCKNLNAGMPATSPISPVRRALEPG